MAVTKYFFYCSILCLTMTFVNCNNREREQLPVYNTADFTPLWLLKNQLRSDTIHKIATFSFTDQDNKKITNADFIGKIQIANFFFSSCPSICPKMMHNLQKVQETFKTDSAVLLASFSVMPWVDTVKKLKNYAEDNEIKSNKWHLLTGDAGKIYDLARKSYFAEEAIGFNRDSSEFLHTEHILLVDGHQHLRGIYNGTLPLEMERLIEDIKILKKDF